MIESVQAQPTIQKQAPTDITNLPCIADRFVVLRTIASGGNAKVKLAWDID